MSIPRKSFLFPPLSLAFALLVACGGGEEGTSTPATPGPQATEPGPEPTEPPPATAEGSTAEEPGADPVDVGPTGGSIDIAVTYANTCAACHGAEGAGDGPAGTVLASPPANFADPAFWADHDDDLVAKAIKEGGVAVGKSPLMAVFGAQFDDAQISALVEHLKTFAP